MFPNSYFHILSSLVLLFCSHCFVPELLGYSRFNFIVIALYFVRWKPAQISSDKWDLWQQLKICLLFSSFSLSCSLFLQLIRLGSDALASPGCHGDRLGPALPSVSFAQACYPDDGNWQQHPKQFICSQRLQQFPWGLQLECQQYRKSTT